MWQRWYEELWQHNPIYSILWLGNMPVRYGSFSALSRRRRFNDEERPLGVQYLHLKFIYKIRELISKHTRPSSAWLAARGEYGGIPSFSHIKSGPRVLSLLDSEWNCLIHHSTLRTQCCIPKEKNIHMPNYPGSLRWALLVPALTMFSQKWGRKWSPVARRPQTASIENGPGIGPCRQVPRNSLPWGNATRCTSGNADAAGKTNHGTFPWSPWLQRRTLLPIKMPR